jgi:hypothetical protein
MAAFEGDSPVGEITENIQRDGRKKAQEAQKWQAYER